jgi:hypothetical protein
MKFQCVVVRTPDTRRTAIIQPKEGYVRYWRKVKVLPLQAIKAIRAGRGIAICFFKTSALKVGGQNHAPAALPPGKDPVPIVQEAG